MRKYFFIFFLLIASTSVKQTTTQETIWDQILSEQAQNQTQRGTRALYYNSYQDAVRILTKAVRSNPNDPVARRQLGVALYWTGAVEDAITQYEKSIALNPNDADTHIVLGIAYAWTGDIDRAQQNFEKALIIDPQRADAEMNLSSLWNMKNNREKAIYHMHQAIRLQPSNELYHFQLGTIYAQYNDHLNAINSFKRSIEINPYYEDVYLELGSSYIETGQSEQAIKILKKALSLKPGDQVARLLLASLYRQKNDRERTMKLYREALTLTPGGDTQHISLAVSFRGAKQSKQESDALDQLKNNLQQFPPDQKTQVTIEALYERQADVITGTSGVEVFRKPEKIQYAGFKQMVELESSDEEQRSYDIDQFISDIRKKISALPDQENLRLSMDIKQDAIQKPHSRRTSKKPQKSKVVYQPRRVGNDAGLWVMGTAWMRLVDNLIIPSLNVSNPDRLLLIERGIGYLQRGQADNAYDIFSQLLRNSENDTLALQGLAVAFIEMGNIEEALRCYNAMLRIEPKNKAAQETIEWLKTEE